MKTIGYLGQIDKLYGAPATTRNWNTVVAILRILKGQSVTLAIPHRSPPERSITALYPQLATLSSNRAVSLRSAIERTTDHSLLKLMWILQGATAMGVQ
jgi:hypothetical protein